MSYPLNTTRDAAGRLMWQEIARLAGARKMERVIEHAGVSRSTLYNIRDGKTHVSTEVLWRIAGALNLPTRFFEFVASGEADRIERMAGLRDDLRQDALDALSELPRGGAVTVAPKRRAARG